MTILEADDPPDFSLSAQVGFRFDLPHPLCSFFVAERSLADAFAEGPSVVQYWVVFSNRGLALLAVWAATVLCVRR